jgi:hypothetical protein
LEPYAFLLKILVLPLMRWPRALPTLTASVAEMELMSAGKGKGGNPGPTAGKKESGVSKAKPGQANSCLLSLDKA